VTLRPDSGP